MLLIQSHVCHLIRSAEEKKRTQQRFDADLDIHQFKEHKTKTTMTVQDEKRKVCRKAIDPKYRPMLGDIAVICA